MRSARADVLADMLGEIATRLEQAEDVGRRKADSLPADLAKDPKAVDVFVGTWLRGAVSDAVRDVRNVAGKLRPPRRRAVPR